MSKKFPFQVGKTTEKEAFFCLTDGDGGAFTSAIANSQKKKNL